MVSSSQDHQRHCHEVIYISAVRIPCNKSDLLRKEKLLLYWYTRLGRRKSAELDDSRVKKTRPGLSPTPSVLSSRLPPSWTPLELTIKRHHPLSTCAPSSQVNFAGHALGCSVMTDTSRTGADSEQDEAAANGSTEANGRARNDAGGGGGGGAAAANGELHHPRRPEEQNQEVFALSNTEDNDSIQGLVRSGGYSWIGRFRLPPAQPGEDESEVGRKGCSIKFGVQAVTRAGASRRNRHASLCALGRLRVCVC